ncbi:MAG: pyruvate kinase [Pseudomonadota bacterium]
MSARTAPRTKILATLGPASSAPHRIDAMIAAGASAFRLNFSHGSHEDHAERFNTVREAGLRAGRPVAIVADLQGPKLRVGKLHGGELKLSYNTVYNAVLAEEADEGVIPIPHPELFEALKEGDAVMVNDGAFRFVVETPGATEMRLRCEVPGLLTNNKGVNIPGRRLPLDALTEKDRRDLAFAVKLGVDFIALSFVQCVDDLRLARSLTGDSPARLIAKIEKPAALDDLEAIVDAADCLMVARGDLGVELPLEAVPRAQRQIIRMARTSGKPVIVATQMLESMIDAPTPTRAEASDTASAAYLGADCVMLSAETAVGRHPEAAIAIMNRILTAVAADEGSARDIAAAADLDSPQSDAEVVAFSAAWAAGESGAEAILASTLSGGTAYAVSRFRPSSPVLAITPNETTSRQLALVWGVKPILVDHDSNFEELSSSAAEVAQRELDIDEGARIVLIAGQPSGISGGTNTMKLIRVGAKP